MTPKFFKKPLFVGALFSNSSLFLFATAFLTSLGHADEVKRPFAKSSYCMKAVDMRPNQVEVYLLLEETTSDEWVYSLMSQTFADSESFDLFDGGNTCTTTVVGAERAFKCENLNTQSKTKLATDLKFEKLIFETKVDIEIADQDNDQKAAAKLAAGKHNFELMDLDLCTERL
jgi:hypothetical protein